jgi:hypothetical protein
MVVDLDPWPDSIQTQLWGPKSKILRKILYFFFIGRHGGLSSSISSQYGHAALENIFFLCWLLVSIIPGSESTARIFL